MTLLCVYICPLPLGLHPSNPHPSRSSEPQAKLLAPYSRFPLAMFYPWQCIYVSPNIPIHPTLPSPTSTCPFPMSVSLLPCCRCVHMYHFSRFHIDALIHDIYFSFSAFILYKEDLLYFTGHSWDLWNMPHYREVIRIIVLRVTCWKVHVSEFSSLFNCQCILSASHVPTHKTNTVPAPKTLTV